MTDNFKQAQFKMTDADAQVLSGKNSNMTIKYKKSCEVRCQKELSHNRNKKYILEEGKKVDFLVDLGVMTKDGKIVKDMINTARLTDFLSLSRIYCRNLTVQENRQ